MTELIRKNNLPIGGEQDDYHVWDEFRFIFYVRATNEPDLAWGYLAELGSYRCVSSNGMIIPERDVRIARMNGEEHVKVKYAGERLDRYDIRIEKIIDGQDGAEVNPNVYKDGELTTGNEYDSVVSSYHYGYVDIALNDIRGYGSSKHLHSRYLLSTGSPNVGANNVDLLLLNKTTGMGRHVTRENITGIMPSVISIPAGDVLAVRDEIGDDWEGDGVVLRILLTEGKPEHFPVTIHRHDRYLDMYGYTQELIGHILHIVSDLESSDGVDDIKFLTSVWHGETDSGRVLKAGYNVMVETDRVETFTVRDMHPGQTLHAGVDDTFHIWDQVPTANSNLKILAATIPKPIEQFSLYYKPEGQDYEKLEVGTSLVDFTTTTITPTSVDHKIYILMHGCSSYVQETLGVNQRAFKPTFKLRNKVEVKLNDTWLIRGLDYIIMEDETIQLVTMLWTQRLNSLFVVTYGNELYHPGSDMLIGMNRSHMFDKIRGANPDDIIITNTRRSRYADILGQGVIPNTAYSYNSLHNNIGRLNDGFGVMVIYSAYHRAIAEWMNTLTETEIRELTREEILTNGLFDEEEEVHNKLGPHSGTVQVKFSATVTYEDDLVLRTIVKEAFLRLYGPIQGI